MNNLVIVAVILALFASAGSAQPAGGLPPQANQRAHDNMDKKNQNNGQGQNPQHDPVALVPYSTDFEGTIDDYWSVDKASSLARTGRFLGTFTDDESATLRVTTEKGRIYVLIFDLLIFDHWEGTARGADVDQMRVEVNGSRVFSHQFSTGTNAQTFNQKDMWLAAYENLGYSGTRDLWLRDVRVVFEADDTISDITFYANLFPDNQDESWAIDNVRVITVEAYAEPLGGLHVEWFGSYPRTQKADFATESSADFVTRERQIAWLPTFGKVHPDLNADDIAWRSYGGLVVPRAGNWQFRLTSDDGSMLRINNQLVIDNDGDHSMRQRTATIQLAQGIHPIDVRIYERGGTVGLILEWRGPGDAHWAVIPPDSFTYLGSPAPVTFTDTTTVANLHEIDALGQIALSIADLDNDGIQDIAFGGINHYLAFGRSDHTFALSRSTTFKYYQQAIADVNNDGTVDLWSGYSGLIQNEGDRQFTIRGYPGSPTPYAFSLMLADFDADGNMDLSTTWGSSMTHSRSLGSASTITPIEYIAFAFDDLFGRASLAANMGSFSDIDINGDGLPDYFHASGRYGLVLTTSSPQGYSSTRLVTPSSNEDWILASARPAIMPNGDAYVFYSLNSNGQSNGILRLADGRWTNVTSQFSRFSEFRWVGADWGDVTNNGHLDLLVWSFYDHRIRIYLNNGDGTFTPRITVPASIQHPADARFADVDNDGDLDVVIAGFYSSAIWRNDLDDARSLAVRLIGAGQGATNAAAIGTTVTLSDPRTGVILGRRDVTSARGGLGAGPLWLHFGGLDPDAEYLVTAHFLSGSVAQRVIPRQTSTTIGPTTITQMLTIEEPAPQPGRRIARWREADQEQTILAALRSEARRRGLGEKLNELIEQGRDDRPTLLRLLGAKTVRDALGADSAVLRDLAQGGIE